MFGSLQNHHHVNPFSLNELQHKVLNIYKYMDVCLYTCIHLSQLSCTLFAKVISIVWDVRIMRCISLAIRLNCSPQFCSPFFNLFLFYSLCNDKRHFLRFCCRNFSAVVYTKFLINNVLENSQGNKYKTGMQKRTTIIFLLDLHLLEYAQHTKKNQMSNFRVLNIRSIVGLELESEQLLFSVSFSMANTFLFDKYCAIYFRLYSHSCSALSL